jgi:hypothetical protein
LVAYGKAASFIDPVTGEQVPGQVFCNDIGRSADYSLQQGENIHLYLNPTAVSGLTYTWYFADVDPSLTYAQVTDYVNNYNPTELSGIYAAKTELLSVYDDPADATAANWPASGSGRIILFWCEVTGGAQPEVSNFVAVQVKATGTTTEATTTTGTTTEATTTTGTTTEATTTTGTTTEATTTTGTTTEATMAAYGKTAGYVDPGTGEEVPGQVFCNDTDRGVDYSVQAGVNVHLYLDQPAVSGLTYTWYFTDVDPSLTYAQVTDYVNNYNPTALSGIYAAKTELLPVYDDPADATAANWPASGSGRTILFWCEVTGGAQPEVSNFVAVQVKAAASVLDTTYLEAALSVGNNVYLAQPGLAVNEPALRDAVQAGEELLALCPSGTVTQAQVDAAADLIWAYCY